MRLTEHVEGGWGVSVSAWRPLPNIDSASPAVRLKVNFAASHFDLVTSVETYRVSLITEQKIRLKIFYWQILCFCGLFSFTLLQDPLLTLTSSRCFVFKRLLLLFEVYIIECCGHKLCFNNWHYVEAAYNKRVHWGQSVSVVLRLISIPYKQLVM